MVGLTTVTPFSIWAPLWRVLVVTFWLWTSQDTVSVITCLQVRSAIRKQEIISDDVLCLGLLYHDMDNVLLIHRQKYIV